MARPKRNAKGGYYYHVYNRSNAGLRIFRKQDDFLAFEEILAQAQQRINVDILGYCLMKDHWHLLLRPHEDGDLSEFMRWVGVTHVLRYHNSKKTKSSGHIYQGRFKSFPVQGGSTLLNLLRFIESHPIRANLVEKARDYPWSSYDRSANRERAVKLKRFPVKIPKNWGSLLQKKMDASTQDLILNSIKRGAPLGKNAWVKKTAIDLDLQSTINKRGRPRKDV